MTSRWAGLAAGILVATASPAIAQEQQPFGSSDPTTAAPPPPSTSAPLQTPRPAPDTVQPDDAPVFTLAQVRFEGSTAVSQEALSAAWREHRGRPVSFTDLRNIGRRAERIYAAAGYPFVAVVLTPQDVQGGAVTYRVIEGHISDLTVLGLDPVARRQVTGAFQPLVGRTPLPLSDVEEAYDTARQIPGLSIAGALRRGSDVGGMDLVIQARRQTWRAYANVNNAYSDAVGPWGVLLGVDYNGASRFGDRTSLQAYSTTDWGEQAVLKLSHTRVINRFGTTVEGEVLRAWASPQGDIAPLDLATDVVSLRLQASHPLMVRGPFSLRGRLGLEYADQETQIFQTIDLTRDHLRIAVAGLDARWRGDRLEWRGGLEIRQGLDVAGASSEGDPDISRFGANPQATVFRATGMLDADLPRGFNLNLRALAQYSGDSLTAPEEFSFGNLTVGRGYKPGSSFGDSAVAVAVDLSGPALAVTRGITARPFIFHDAAEVWNREPGAPDGRWIRSWGGGLRFEAQGRFVLTVTYAAPLDEPLGLGEGRPGDAVLVNLTFGIPELFRGLGRPASGARP